MTEPMDMLAPGSQPMRELSELSHYEVLEVGPEASVEDLERAYRIMRATFEEDSLATYSVCAPEEAERMRERIELAYQVLTDPERRSEYDQGLGEAPPPDVDDELDPSNDHLAPPPEVSPEIAGFDDLEEEGPIGGATLRRARLQHGIDLERIASTTKISASHLRCLEEERFEDLPASVYVRGFLTAYARCVGLDPARIVDPYLEKLAVERTPPAKSRRRGR
jgi:flagellar biosynthesis protein FlhG